MNPSQLFSEVARQNQLLKETINSFQLTLDSEEQDLENQTQPELEEDETLSNLSYISSSSPTLSNTSHSTCSSSSSNSSIQQTRIETLIDLLNKQELRLNVLEEFGSEVLLNSSLPIYNGISSNPNQISIQEWCRIISNRLNSLKSINQFTKINSKSFLIFVLNHLDLKPKKLIINLLKSNQILIQTKFPNQIPLKFQSSSKSYDYHDSNLLDLLDYPFQLHVLRHPRALLNLLQSKFTEFDKRSTTLKDLNQIKIKPSDSLLFR